MNSKKILFFLTGILFSFGLFAQTYNPDFLDGRLMFKLKNDVSIESEQIIKNLPAKRETNKIVDINDYPEFKALLSNYSFTKLERPSYYSKKSALMRIFRVHFTNYSDIDNIIRDLQQLNIVEYAEKEPIYKLVFSPNDAYYSSSNYSWYLDLVNAEQAWDISLGDNAIKVAIVDNAVFCGHSDLTTFTQRDVADNDNDATPPEESGVDFMWSHGTHCAGLATADINNGTGMPSLGGNVELIGVKATPDAGTSNSVYYSYDGVQWACQNGANVVSMSFGGGGSQASFQTLINSYPGIVFLAAAGNDGITTIQYPGGYNNVICVGSCDYDDTRSSFSNYNGGTTWVDIASPGGYSFSGLLSTVYTAGGNNYGQMGGTSMATPFAAGLAGLMLSLNPSMSPTEILNCMTSSGVNINQDIGPRIDAYGAVQCVQSTLTGDPFANFIADNPSITVGNSVTFTDLSNDGGNTITDWQWTFTGGLPTSFIGQTPPAITYNNTGVYTVSLIVTNSQNSDTETKTDYINVTVEPYGAWIEQATGFSTVSRGINYISIVDADIIWATAYDGSGGGANIQEFTKTIDGGDNWTPGTINIGNTLLGVSMIHAFDENTAWLAAYPNGTGQTGGIWKTTNGGSTWTRQNSATYNDASSFTNVVYFWDANNGFCQGDPINGDFELYTTTNGGTTWTLVTGANIPDPESGEYGYTRQIEVVGDVVWFTTNHGRIYHSTDRGYNFSVYQSPLSDFGGTSMSGNLSFKDANTGLIVDVNNVVYESTNSGSSWITVTTTGNIFNAGLCFIEGTDIVFTTGQTGSSYSEDGGTAFNPIDTEQHTAVEFINSGTGWSGFFNESSTSKGIWKWEPISTLVAEFSGIPTTICAGGSVDFTDQTTGGTPTSWDWSFPGGTPSSSALQNPTITYNTPGIYDVTLIVDDGNGPVNTTITSYITVNDVPAQPSAINGDTAPCEGATEVYDVTLDFGTTYSWTLPGGWTGTSTTNSISATVSSTAGTITVTPSNSCGTGTAQTLSVSPLTIPAQPSTITGNSPVCETATEVYSVTNVAGVTYTWGLPASWTGTSTTNSISATIGASGGTITVTPSNACGSGSAETLVVSVNNVPSQPSAISGAIDICNGDVEIYDVTDEGVTYTWTLPTGWTGTSTTNSITATAGATSGTITVTPSNSCGNGTAQTLTVNVSDVPAQPSVINGDNAPCDGTTEIYDVTLEAGVTYVWTLPAGWTGTSTTNSISVTVGANPGVITVTPSNSCGTGTAQTLNVTSVVIPAQTSVISGNTTVCEATSEIYSVTNVTGITYIWDLPASWTGTSTTNSITATIGTIGGTITITPTNSCGSGPVETIVVSVNNLPAQPSAISGTVDVCEGDVEIYDVTDEGVTYAWTLPTGWTGTSTTNSITATAGANSGTVTVTPSNSCGNGTAQTLTVNVASVPSASFSYVDNNGDVTFTNTSSPNGTTFYWYFGDGNTSNMENSAHTYLSSGNYDVTFIVTNSCSSDTIITTINVLIMDIVEFGNAFISVYPNPANDIINIKLDNINYDIDYTLLDINGKMIASGTIKANSNIKQIKLTDFAAGVYNLKLNSKNETINKRVIIQ